MLHPARIEPLEPPASQQPIAEIFNAYIHNPLAPQPEEVQHLEAELAKHQDELAEQNRQLREAQQFLEAYRDLYIDLYDFAPLGYATFDEDGFVQEINLAGAAMLGADRDAITGQAFSDFVVEEDREAFLNHVRQCARERREVTSEARLLTKDNVPITVQLHSIPIKRANEEAFCKTAFTDITQRRAMEEALRKSQAFLQTVIDSIPDVMLVIGQDYRIVLANRVAREMAPDIDPTSLTCHRFSHHHDVPCAGEKEPCPLCKVITTKAPVMVMHTHYKQDGEEVLVEINAAPVFDEAGEVTHIIETCRDITARKRAEDALERERDLLHTLIDNLPDYIYFKDAQSRFVAANLATAKIMGVSAPNELLGKTDCDFYPPELAAEYRADEERIMASGQALINKDEPHMDREGNPRTVMTTKVPLKDKRGKVVGLVGISRDITERKKAEEAAIAAQQHILELQLHQQESIKAELDKARAALVRQTRLAAMGQLSSSIAHELRTPLACISHAAYYLQRKIPQAEREYHEFLAMIRHEIQRAYRIVTNCTAISQGKPSRKSLIALSAVFDQVRAELDLPEAIQWHFTYDREPFMIYADSAQMEQVLNNLFQNAIQALDGTGRISIEASRAERFDVIRVSDTGPGVPPELREQLFEPLVTSKPRGTGLGLAICRQFVEQHGGRIELCSGDEPGTTIQISLPIQEE
jgi:PAS domain S-box-containing protein